MNTNTNVTTTTTTNVAIRPTVAPAYRSYDVRKSAYDARQATIAYLAGKLTMINWKHEVAPFGRLVGLQDEALEHLIMSDLVTTSNIGSEKAKRSVKSLQMFVKVLRDAYDKREYTVSAKTQSAPTAPKNAKPAIKSASDLEKAQLAIMKQEARLKAMQDAIRAYQTNGLSDPALIVG